MKFFDFFKYFLKQQRNTIFLLLAFCIVFIVCFALYHLPVEAVAYPAFICVVIGIAVFAVQCAKAYKKHLALKSIQKLSASLIDRLPEITEPGDEDFEEIIRMLCEEQNKLLQNTTTKYNDMIDYYTTWVHQIKTPISAMRLNLQNEDSALTRKLSSDLSRIEQYVEMVLTFLRLDSDSTDYVLQTTELDGLVKTSIKKFKNEFIERKIKLEYEPSEASVITDEKWLSFVIEQLLSNALKYTPSGSITVKLEEPKTLCICDTGIGISPEDLPRVFERGYTGYNGRSHKSSSGLGLFLCKRICNNLGHKISLESAPGKGTVARIDLSQRNLEIE